MAYIGRRPLIGNYIVLDAISPSATTTFNLTQSGSAYSPQLAQNCIVSVNGVIQAPNTSYTISGSTIVFSTALSTTDTIDFITVLGDVQNVGTPTAGTVTAASFATGFNGVVTWQNVQTTNFTAVAGRGYPVNTTSAGITMTLPASATTGATIQVVDYAGTFATNKLTINPNGLKINGSTANEFVLNNNEGLTLTYIDATQGWIGTAAINEGSTAYSSTYTASYLIVAGGGGGAGGGASAYGGGGGAGGFLSSTTILTPGTVYTIIVGGGGSTLTNGSSSSISGSGLTTITSAGGGGGGDSSRAGGSGNAGGSGGGAGSNGTGGAGNTPSTSPSQGNTGGNGSGIHDYSAGGGGGAGAVGVNAGPDSSGSNGGAGGAGTSSLITGSSVTYAGGGGGQSYSATPGAGGSGGGGTGGTPGTNATAGTVNTGGGGGGGDPSRPGASGGSGVVILSVPTVNYSGTTTGSPTITTSGSNTIIKFTGNGTYTA
jgi:hypothetical protein